MLFRAVHLLAAVGRCVRVRACGVMISDVTLELAFEHDEAEIRALEDVLVAHQRNTDLMVRAL